jgi:radical SAM superfamily enzyme with C-terminal helix-hairpin-helix motif
MSDETPPLFTPAAQWTCAVLVAVGLALTAWQSIGKSPWSIRPLPIVPGPIDLNTSNESRLSAIPGIGRELARRIVAYRDSNGAYKAVDDCVGYRASALQRWSGCDRFCTSKPMTDQ